MFESEQPALLIRSTFTVRTDFTKYEHAIYIPQLTVPPNSSPVPSVGSENWAPFIPEILHADLPFASVDGHRKHGRIKRLLFQFSEDIHRIVCQELHLAFRKQGRIVRAEGVQDFGGVKLENPSLSG